MKKNLFVGFLEKVDKEFLLDDKYAKIRTKKFSNKSGIYALYDKKDKLYYVGRASDLYGRLKQHSKHNKHSGKWDTFSIYLTKKKNIEVELEAIVLSFLWDRGRPKGNTQKPNVKKDRKMRADILREMEKINKKMFRGGNFKRTRKPKTKAILSGKNSNPLLLTARKSKSSSLEGLVLKNQPLKATRKGKDFHAILLPSGEIEYQGNKGSASATAKVATGSIAENGKTFWKIQNRFNEWVTLKEFMKKSA